MRSQMPYTNGSFEICRLEHTAEAALNTQLKHSLAVEKNIYAQAKIIKSLQDRF